MRTQKGWSQSDLARACNKDRQAIEKLENGKVNPTLYTLLEVANALEITLPKLVNFEWGRLFTTTVNLDNDNTIIKKQAYNVCRFRSTCSFIAGAAHPTKPWLLHAVFRQFTVGIHFFFYQLSCLAKITPLPIFYSQATTCFSRCSFCSCLI